MKLKVVVFHPLQQHSHQMAWALHEAGVLSKYVSGTPVLSDNNEYKFLPRSIRQRVKSVDIPKSLRQHTLRWPLMVQAVKRLPIGFTADNLHKAFHAFDAWFAKQLPTMNADIVVGYENSCAKTFEAAKQLGIKCVLEAPSIHHKSAESLIDFSQFRYLEQINQRKDKEVELADKIITCSKFAGDTYIQNGVASEKIYPVLLGAELPFGLPEKSIKREFLTFIFAGAMSYRKNIDNILGAFAEINKDRVKAKLKIVGGSESEEWIDLAGKVAGVEYIGHVAQVEVYQHISQSDCLILVSRFDSFGMVVAEAMAVGKPAIVSDATGAKEIIEKHPGCGWVVGTEKASLINIITKLLEDNVLLDKAGTAAETAAKQFTWSNYRKRVVAQVFSS